MILTTERMKKRRKPSAGSSTHWLAVLIHAEVLAQAELLPTCLGQLVRPRFCSTSELWGSHALGQQVGNACACVHLGRQVVTSVLGRQDPNPRPQPIGTPWQAASGGQLAAGRSPPTCMMMGMPTRLSPGLCGTPNAALSRQVLYGPPLSGQISRMALSLQGGAAGWVSNAR